MTFWEDFTKPIYFIIQFLEELVDMPRVRFWIFQHKPQDETNPNERNVIYYSLRYTPLIRDQLCVGNEKTVVEISLFNHISCDNNLKFHSVVSEGLSRRERLTKWAKDHWIQSHEYFNLRILGFLVSSFIFTTINFTTFIPTSISHNFHPLTFIPITFNAPFLRIENRDSPFGDGILVVIQLTN